MKKLSAIILSVMLLTGMAGLAAGAAPAKQKLISETVEYFEDGSSATVSVYEDIMPVTRAAAYTKSGSKSYTMKDSAGKALWTFTLNGSFQVNPGVSAACTSASYTKKIVDSQWSLKTASATKSGNKAIGDATFQRKVLFIVAETKNCHLELKCDVNGNLS